MSNPIERYQKLAFKHAFSRIHHYPVACKDLSLILREAYHKLPKNLQSVVFQDTLSAFRLLPEMQSRSAVSAAHLLFQSAEAVLPKQRKNLAVKEFKHAKVAHKRRCKAHSEEEASDAAELPQDVLVHIFSFLDIQSLVSVGLVCWSWNFAASNNQLWQLHYAIFFGSKHDSSQQNGRQGENKEFTSQDISNARTNINWREAFKRTYNGKSSKRLASDRGYCSQCETIVWLDNMKCCNGDCGLKSGNWQIMHVSSHEVVEYLLYGSSSIISSSESDSDSDEELITRLWAYPRDIGRYQYK
ncbi:hypothetical protein P3X46_030516 [Hevea brasiliensis]|uniref:F-box domain-containing protein n=1 Tax=Hevea brasiliensis TaxID=3981 RepID=A0ABQ9KHH0_HEVBR|nr:F-box protein At5g52880 [Hevea brasiliensis]KAJ9139818.1 hypothetical protein P3X46_030516 [Hevea brasiliensis]